MKGIYFDIDNPAFIKWLKTHPEGSYNVLIGSDRPEDSVDTIFEIVAIEGVALVQWLAKKIQVGEMQIKVNTKIKLPQGVVLDV